jgi:hypothetical protein
LSIESIIHVNFHRIQHLNDVKIFTCLLKSIKTNLTISLKQTYEDNLGLSERRKTTCNFQFEENESIYEYSVATIRDGDFGDQNQTDKLPYFVINFQKPTIIKVNNPKLRSVG